MPASIPERCEVRSIPAFGLASWIVMDLAQSSQDCLRATVIFIVLGRELMRVHTWIAADDLPDLCELRLFLGRTRIKALNRPAFSFRMGQSDHNRNIERWRVSRLFQPRATCGQVVGITDEHDAIELVTPQHEQPQGPSGGLGVKVSGLAIEMTHGPNVELPSQVRNIAPEEMRIVRRKASPSPIVFEDILFQPIDLVDEDSIREVARGPPIRRRLADHDEGEAHGAETIGEELMAQFSPTTLQNSPGLISFFHSSNSGC